MGEWLVQNGLDSQRLIIEDQADTTVENAEMTYKILIEEYPSVKSIVMVTSDYHIERGSILFYSKIVLSALESGGELIEIISNCGYYAGYDGYESYALQARGVGQVADVSVNNSVELSKLTGLSITQENTYVAGEQLEVNIVADYDSDYVRDVTELTTITGFDPMKDASQKIVVSYTENGITATGEFLLSETNLYISVYKDLLKNLVEEVESTITGIYTDATAIPFVASLTKAHEVLADENSNNKLLEETYNELLEAFEGLIKKTNVAFNKPVTTNRIQTNANVITDGTIKNSKNYYWVSKDDTTGDDNCVGAAITIDLEKSYDVSAIIVYPYWGTDYRYYQYTLYGSTDNVNWFKVGENLSTNTMTSAGVSHEMDGTISYLKLEGVNTFVEGREDIDNIAIIEIEIYGQATIN